jgi:hypothetical protein
MPPRAGIESDVPGGAEDVDPAGSGALRELAALFADERLLDVAELRKLASKEPDLLLATAPIPARVDLKDAQSLAPRPCLFHAGKDAA